MNGHCLGVSLDDLKGIMADHRLMDLSPHAFSGLAFRIWKLAALPCTSF